MKIADKTFIIARNKVDFNYFIRTNQIKEKDAVWLNEGENWMGREYEGKVVYLLDLWYQKQGSYALRTYLEIKEAILVYCSPLSKIGELLTDEENKV